MRISTYTKMDKKEVLNTIESLELSLRALTSLQDKGFKTINEAFKSVIGKQVTKREYKKFAELLGNDIDFTSMRFSNGLNGLEFYKQGDSYQDRKVILMVVIYLASDVDLFAVKRHGIKHSLWLEDHTIESLLCFATEELQKLKQAFKAYDSIEDRIKSYELELEQAVKDLRKKHIDDIKILTYSRSV